MTYSIGFDFVEYTGWIVVGLILIAAIVNRQVLTDAIALSKSVKKGTGMAVNQAVNFFDGDGDGDIDLDDLKYVASKIDVKALKAAIVAELKQKEYADAGVPISPEKQKNTGLLFKEAVELKSKGI